MKEVGPSASPCGEASNHLRPRCLKNVVVSAAEKAQVLCVAA
jgi:hypothetical protein